MRKEVFKHEDTFKKYDKCLDELEIWSRWKDDIGLNLACQVRHMIEKNAYHPYNGLELTFLQFFDEHYTPTLVERHLIHKKLILPPAPKKMRGNRTGRRYT